MQKIVDGQNFFLGICNDSRGASGGVAIMWSSHLWDCKSFSLNQNWLKVNLVQKDKSCDIIVYNVYIPNQFREKEQCWEELKEDMDKEQNPNVILAGDLNLVLHANEKRGGNFFPDPFRNQLEGIMSDHELMDIIPKNRKFTWNNRRLGPGNIMERLDRILVNISLLSTFADAHSKVLSSSVSDHFPVMLTLESNAHLGPIPFRYNPLWRNNAVVTDIIEGTWKQHIEGSPSFIWEMKIKKTRKALKDWAKISYKEPERVKKNLQQELDKIQIQIEQQGLTAQLKKEEWEAQGQLMRIKREEETKWRTKSRQLWLKEGDKNTAYFHKQATVRMIRNNVTSITDGNGSQHIDQEAIKRAASLHYKKLLSENHEESDYSDMLQHIPKGISQEMNEKLNQEITEEEIKKTIWTLQPDKSPGPDGFPINFYRDFWYLIKKDLVKMLRGIQRKKKMGGFTNSTFLALIPKETRPTTFSRFRPISLCNTSYKIFAKIIASRLQPLLPSLISENQGGFLSNRQIHDSIILVQEAIHSSISRQEKGFVLKLDLANAFDRVRHSFLFAVLRKIGFSPSFISTIAACISEPWISPLINGRTCDAFQSSRGLRQGCPLSPYLFILMADSISRALDYNRRVGLISGIKFGNGVKNINHSQFADDTLLIGGASTTIAKRFKALLDQFMECSGGEINYQKSCIYSWNITTQTAHSIANIFGVAHKANWDHFTYLGMPVSMGSLKANTWNEILDKVKRKIHQWGTQWLNPAGRIILLKSGGKKEKNKFNLVSWKSVIQSPDRGGLGIRSPKLLNLAFGIKTAWRLITEPNAWWKQVLECKYLSSKRQNLLETDIPIREATKIWQLCKKAIPHLKQNTSKVPRGGESIDFATNKIMGLPPLITIEEAIPIIHHLNCKGIQKLHQISKWDDNNGAWIGWEFPPIPPMLDSSLKILQSNLQNRAPIRRGAIDGFRWDPTGSNYSIKSGYQYISNDIHQIPIWNHWRIIWNSEAIPKVKFFNWLLLKGKVLTAENLKKRGINGPSRCPNCCSAEESIQHLFLDCPFAKQCWISLSSLGNITWQPHQSIPETIHAWRRNSPWKKNGSKIVKRIWAILPLNLLWKIWLVRNKKIFQNKDSNVRMTCNKAHTLAQETIAANYKERLQAADYTVEERTVLRHILDRPGQSQEAKTSSNQNQIKLKAWEIRLSESDLNNWKQKSQYSTLHFDGASKSNPGQAGAGVVISNEHGEEICSYEWSLGRKSNNIAEALALYQGLVQLKKLGIRKALVFGDSSIIIRLMNSNLCSPNRSLQQHIDRTKMLIDSFEDVKFYHLLRNLNAQADKHANMAVGKQEGLLICKEREEFFPLP
eukprot:PITA_22073